ncbi:MAG: (2Fe-2S) ferredoxin domain-containing protein [Alphaproteobacteria bacterium]|nr:(2Fe-2S) ferredoxin domain-containing protein [Alphaproteobacteria bacterium]
MTHIIKVCMGSSCFARGNAKNLQIIQNFIEQHGLDAQVELTGLRCCGSCSAGPNIYIDDEAFHNLDQGSVLDILEHKFNV